MSFWNCRQQMGWAALIMGMSVLLSRFMGLFRDKVISFLFGATSESDIYFAAFVIPDFINYLLAGAYFSITLIPLLAAYFDESEEEGWRFFSTVFTWIVLVITPLTVLAIILAPHLARIAAPGLQGESMLRLVYFLRIIMPAQICFLLGSCLTAILYLRKQFSVPALTPLVYNFLIILGGILLRKRGMEGFCWGVLAGAFLGNLLLPYLAVKWGDGLHLYFSLRHEGLKKFFILALPLMLGQSIVVLDEQLVRIFGSLVGTGAISWLNYARRIMLVPVGVVAQAAGVASYPFLAELVAKDEHSRFYQTLRTALQSVMTLLIPLSIWMMVVAEPTIRLIFQQGHFSALDTLHTARLLQISLLAVCCWGIQQILGRAFYACQDTLTPAVLGTLATLVSIPLFYYLARSMDATGVALASVSSMVFYTALLSFWWWHRFGGETFSGLGKDQFKILGFSLIAAVPSVIIVNYEPIDGMNYPYWASLFEISVSGLCFVCLFGLLSSYFAPSLVRPFLLRTGRLGSWLIR